MFLIICQNSYNIVTIIYTSGEKMIRKIIQIGNSWGVILPATILALLKINPIKDKVEFIIEGDKLIVQKAKKE